jgi:histidinol-phosphatase (PHP family)
MKWEMLDKYISELKELKEKYLSQIQIYTALEVDYIPGISGVNVFKDTALDYTIGSVHYVTDEAGINFLTIDHTSADFERGIKELFAGDVKRAVRAYYANVNKMLTEDAPDIVGHIDLIKKFNKNNRFFDETSSWYLDEVANTIEILAKSKSILEINTRGKYKNLTQDFYASEFILRKAKQLDIPVMINSDSHDVADLLLEYTHAENLMREIGFEKKTVFYNGRFNEEAI